MNLVLRPGTPDDAEACGTICFEAFKAISDQHNFPWDFPSPEAAISVLSQLLSRPDIYSVVAEVDASVVGSNFLWEGNSISGVGPITVNPSVQNAAVGRRLMEDVIDRAKTRGAAGVRLVQAAYHNRSLSLYTKLGFDVCEPLSVVYGQPVGVSVEGYKVRAATEDDRAACNRLCLKVHGHERGQDFTDGVTMGTAMVVEHDGRITGYTTMLGYFGHTVCETNEDMKALVGAAESLPEPGFLLPTRNSEMLRWCLRHGLRVVQPMTLMSMGLYNEPRGAFMPGIIY